MLLAAALCDLGVDAGMGAVPGEYCPGAHSVNGRGTVKLIGTAQRAMKGAGLFSSLVVVADHVRLQPVLTEVYRHLELPFDGASVGSLTGEQPTPTVDAAESALLEAYRVTGTAPALLEPDTRA